MNARNGLTKIDVLVTLGIVLFLAGNIPMIMAGGRGNAKRQVCMANLRELTIGWQSYAEANRGKVPPGDVGYSWAFPASIGGPQRAWVEFPHHYPHTMPPTVFTNGIGGGGAYDYGQLSMLSDEIWNHTISEGLLWNYIKDYRVYKCPVGNRNNQVTYSMAHSMNTWRDPPTHQGSAGTGSVSRTISNINQIQEPDKRYVFLDTGVMKGGAFFVNYDASGLGQGKWFDLPPMRHEKGTTFSFADGHTIYRRWTDPHTLSSANDGWGGGTADLCDCDLRWMVKITWGDVPYTCTNPDKHCEY